MGLFKNDCAIGVCEPQRTQGLLADVAQGDHTLIKLTGPGTFVSASITKQGGGAGLTFVKMDIDGRNVVNLSYEAAANVGYNQPNNYGLVLLDHDPIRNLTIGFPVLLTYKRSLTISVTVQESGVAQILANVIHGK